MALTNAASAPFGVRIQTDMDFHFMLRPLSLTLSEGRAGILLLLVMHPHQSRYQMLGNIASGTGHI